MSDVGGKPFRVEFGAVPHGVYTKTLPQSLEPLEPLQSPLALASYPSGVSMTAYSLTKIAPSSQSNLPSVVYLASIDKVINDTQPGMVNIRYRIAAKALSEGIYRVWMYQQTAQDFRLPWR